MSANTANQVQIMDERLKYLHISATSIAHHCGVSVRTMYDWRNGSCPAHVIKYLDYLVAAKKQIEAIRKS